MRDHSQHIQLSREEAVEQTLADRGHFRPVGRRVVHAELLPAPAYARVFGA